jgi:ribonuclease HI
MSNYEIVYNRTMQAKSDEAPLATWPEAQDRVRELNSIGAGVFARKTGNTHVKQATRPIVRKSWHGQANVLYMFVDAWTSGNPGIGGCRAVFSDRSVATELNSNIAHTNNFYEIQAIEQGIAYALNHEQESARIPVVIYTDSNTALAWIRNGSANTKDDDIWISNMIRWIRDMLTKYPHVTVEKWDTEHYGEIPADYGRK